MDFFRFLLAPLLNCLSRTDGRLSHRRRHLRRPMAIHSSRQRLPSLCPNSNLNSNHSSHNNRSSSLNLPHLDQRVRVVVTDYAQPIRTAVAQCRPRQRHSKRLNARWVTCATPPLTPMPLPMRTTAEEVAGGEAATPHEMSKWETYGFQRQTLTLRVQTRSSTRRPSRHHPAQRQKARSRRRERYRKMKRGRTTLARASSTRSRPRHKRRLRRSAAVDVADAAAHAIDGRKSGRGTLPLLVSLVVSA